MAKVPPYKPERVEQIKADALEWIAGGRSLLSFSQEEGTPDYTTLRRWRETDQDFDASISRAREAGTEAIAEDCLRIADDPSLDAQQKRVMIDTRLRLIGKWNAKQYGDKVEVEQGVTIKVRHTFPEVGGPEVIEGTAEDVTDE